MKDYNKGIGYIAMLILKDDNPSWIVKWLRLVFAASGGVAFVYGLIWAVNSVWNMTW